MISYLSSFFVLYIVYYCSLVKNDKKLLL